MDFTMTSDQEMLMTAIEVLAGRFSNVPTNFRGFVLESSELERELEENGFFDIAAVPEFGSLDAAMAVERLAQLPYTTEFALSMLVRPHLDGDWRRPLAVVENGYSGRFVDSAKTIIIIDGEEVSILPSSEVEVESVESLFAYPMGRLARTPVAADKVSADQAAEISKWLRIAIAAEMSGLLQAAISSTVEHLSVRKQFGRPLATFQALRHRLAECAVLAGGVRLLALKAACTGDLGDAALAALHAQESGTRVAYDVHQMLGAMGMTLEHPLHLWTYRMKALLSGLGGRGGQARAVGRYCYGAETANIELKGYGVAATVTP